MARHEILGGLVQVYKRGRIWHCSASMEGGQYRESTKEEDLPQAKQFAEDWYLALRGKSRAGLLSKKREKTFQDAADIFTDEYETITQGERSKKWVDGHQIRLKLHLLPFFGPMGLSEINEGTAQEYRVFRMTGKKPGAKAAKPDESAPPHKPPARSTLHDETVTLRLVLKAAVRKKWIAHVPDLSPPYKGSGKIEHRPWFSLEEYKRLYKATGQYARQPIRDRFRWDAEQLHDFVVFMANTGLRPDEAKNLQHRDIEMVKDEATGELILEIDVRGKRGVGYCKSMPGAVKAYQRLLNRGKWEPQGRKPRNEKEKARLPGPPPLKLPEPTDLVFPGDHSGLFNKILEQENLKFDREGKPRTAYSLRHTYICLRLIEGADIYALAKNCRTSVEMIQKFYAAHIKDMLDASSINVRKPRKRGQAVEARTD
ncbi:site-specific integrase [Bradyrhizobium genosp. A]|uniref:site-specific integrase n=1 Tax=Bradyrhizobium genosp. A TaxID=83626 RepID=UPI003CFB260A